MVSREAWYVAFLFVFELKICFLVFWYCVYGSGVWLVEKCRKGKEKFWVYFFGMKSELGLWVFVDLVFGPWEKGMSLNS